MENLKDLGKRKVDYRSAEVEDINFSDYPDFCDAFISSMHWDDGAEMTEVELEIWCDENPDEVYEIIYDSVY